MIKKLVFLIACVSMSAVSYSQVVSDTWASRSRPLFLHTEMELTCDNMTTHAVSQWNGASGFKWDFNKRSSLTTYHAQGDTVDRTTIELGITGTALAITNKYTTPSNRKILDADIVFNRDIYYFSASGNSVSMWCDPLPANSTPYYSKYDYQSILEHELGHALGFSEYYGDSRCVMYYQLQKGVARRDLCAAERNAVYAAYQPSLLPPRRGPETGWGIF